MDAQKKVLYISYDGLTDPLGQSQVLPYLQGLSQHGYAFTILSFEKKDRLAKDRGLIEKLTLENGIDWIPLTFTTQPPLLSKVYDAIRMRNEAVRLQHQKAFDIIHCRSYVAADVGLYLKKRFGVKFLFDMRGFWADEKVDTGHWKLQNPFFKNLYRYYKQKEKKFLQQADAIISLTQAGKDYLHKQPAFEKLPITVIPCCADLSHFDFHNVDAKQVQGLRTKLQLDPDAKVITYVGSYGGWYMSKEMFRFVRQVQTQDDSYVFLFLTKDDHDAVRHEAQEEGIAENKLIVRSASRNELPLYLALSNVGLFFIRNTFSKTASSPTKHAELMGMGIPVICNTIGDTGRIILETKTGQLVERFDDVSIREAVAIVPKTVSIPAQHIRTCAMELFDLGKGVEKYASVYRNVLIQSDTTSRGN